MQGASHSSAVKRFKVTQRFGEHQADPTRSVAAFQFLPAGFTRPPEEMHRLRWMSRCASLNVASFANNAKGIGETVPGFGRFTVDRFTDGGFESLALKGTVEFAGAVSIVARRELSVADAGSFCGFQRRVDRSLRETRDAFHQAVGPGATASSVHRRRSGLQFQANHGTWEPPRPSSAPGYREPFATEYLTCRILCGGRRYPRCWNAGYCR